MAPFSHTTGFRRYDRGIFRATVAYTQLAGNDSPYFSVTGEHYTGQRSPGEPSAMFEGHRYWLSGCGCMHGAVREVFPEIAPFLVWHLANDRGPMHYVANAVYWAEAALGVSEWSHTQTVAERIASFSNTVALGTLDGDALPDIFTAPDITREEVETQVTDWCLARQERILKAFQAALEAAKNMVAE